MKVDKYIWICDPPEQVEKCLQCGKRECNNCYYTEKHSENQKKRCKKFAERKRVLREAEKNREWCEIEKMLDSGITVKMVSRILGRSKNYFYQGRYKENYKKYRKETRGGEIINGNTDREV